MAGSIYKPKCPRCHSGRIRREERVGWLQTKLLPYFGLYPFHCGKCKANFYLAIRHLRSGKPHQNFQHPEHAA